jgi:hypothetical protein
MSVKESLALAKAEKIIQRTKWKNNYFDWVRQNWYSRGNKLEFDVYHKYLIGIYQDQHEHIVAMKSAQVGLTERMITEAIWLPDQYAENSIYFFPTGSTVSDLVQERIDDPFNSSPYLSEVSGRAKKIMGKQADKVGLKKMSRGYAYFRSSNSPTQITSVAGDMIIVDEVDRVDPKSMPYFEKRLEHSDRKWQRWASTPTIPKMGIHKMFLESDQRYYHVKCNHCGKWQVLDFFTNVLVEEKRMVCVKCKKDIVGWQLEGRWEATNPKSNIHGYHINQLYSSRLNLKKIIEASKGQSEWEITQFYNQNLGLPYEPKGAKITDEDINSCLGEHTAPRHTNEDYTYMGVDVGKVLHWVVRTKDKIVGYGFCPNFTGPNSIEEVVKAFKVRGTVIDAMPEVRKSQEFANLFRGRVKINYYTGVKELTDVKKYWKIDGIKCNSDRTIGLDNTFAEFKNQQIKLPVNLDMEFRNHLKSTVRIIEEGKSGQVKVSYVETSADHYLHACNYAKLSVNIFNVATPEVFVL